MVMSWSWTGILTVSIFGSMLTGEGGALAAAILQGAQAGISLAISMAGAICLWTGFGKLLEYSGISGFLSALFRPLLSFFFTSSRVDPVLAGYLSANICANFLGLGNAATPMGIAAVRRMKRGNTVTHEMCRLIVLNTASIQLIPTNVAAVRSALGCSTPFDLLLPVWITSVCSAGLGITAALFLGKVWKT